MANLSDKFVVARRGLVTQGGVVIEKDDVGVMKAETGNHASIFFIRIWRQAELSKKDFKIIDIEKTGDSFPKKICNVCHKLKKTTEFARNQNAKNNRPVRRPSCKDCRKIIEGVEISKAEKLDWLKKKPSVEPFECPICKKRTIAGITSKVVLEHNHNTGKAGGWICDSCNTGLGRFKDNVELLESAIEFLKKNY
jgi:hypothetical protein